MRPDDCRLGSSIAGTLREAAVGQSDGILCWFHARGQMEGNPGFLSGTTHSLPPPGSGHQTQRGFVILSLRSPFWTSECAKERRGGGTLQARLKDSSFWLPSSEPAFTAI